MAKIIAKEIHQEYMSGAMNPRYYGGETGAAMAVSVIYGKTLKETKSDIDSEISIYRKKEYKHLF